MNLLEGIMPAPMPGLLGDQPQKKSSFFDKLGEIFTGPADPRLSPEQNAAAKRAALTRAGLATLLASSQNPNAMAAIAQGAFAGQGARAQMSQQVVASREQQQLAQLAQSGQLTPEALKQIFQHAVATGNANLANAVVGMMNQVQPDQGVMFGGPENRFMFDKSGKLLQELPGSEKPARPPVYGTPEWFAARERELQMQAKYRVGSSGGGRGAPRTYVDENGQARMGIYNPDTNEFDPIEDASPVVGASEAERKAAAFAAFIPDHAKYIDQIESAPGRVAQALSDKGIREFTNAEQQQLKLAGAALAEAWLRMTTGAAYNEREFATAYALFVPQPGDKKAALDMKRMNRQRLLDMLTTQAGRANPAPKAATPAAGSSDPFAGLPVRK